MENIIFDEVQENIKDKTRGTIIFALDTENSNLNNSECITYCTSLIQVGKQDNQTKNLEFNIDNKVNIFTHPLKFWDYIINSKYPTTEIYVFNADYDVNNLFPFLFLKYPKLKEHTINYTPSNYEYFKKDKKSKYEEFSYEFIKSNSSIIGLNINLYTISKNKSETIYKQIKFYDLAKRTVGSLADNVKSYLGYEMSKEGLDYSIFRDFGHVDYTQEELKYIYEDTYYLKELIKVFVYDMKQEKLTTGSNALNDYKEKLYIDIKENYLNKEHHNYSIYNSLVNKLMSKYDYMLKNKNKLDGKQLKEIDKFIKFIEEHGEDKKYDYILNKLNKQDIFNMIYPSMNYRDFTFCFNNYKGGITRYNTEYFKSGKWIENDGYSFDINSSYPTSMRFKELPYGNGVRKEGQAKKKKGKVYIQRIMVKWFNIKEGYEPIIQLPKNRYKWNTETWVKRCNTPVELYLTNMELEYFNKYYNTSKITYLEYIEFNSHEGLFNRFIDEHYHIKQTSNGAEKSRSKLMLNSLYGKFGQNTITEIRKTEYNQEENRLDEIICKDNNGDTMYSEMNQVYLPVATFITAYSRLKLVNVLNSVNRTEGVKWVYCDTDSVYMIGNKENCIIAMGEELDKNNSGDLGLWKLEKEFEGINIIGIKKYICKFQKNNSTKFTVTLSGINKKYFDKISNDLIVNQNIISTIKEQDLKLIKSNNYYTINDTNKQVDPYLYYDKECTKIIPGAFKSIRKKGVKNGVILQEQAYCILGGK